MRHLALFTVLVATIGCSDIQVLQVPDDGSPLRLIDHLDSARIESPATSAEPVDRSRLREWEIVHEEIPAKLDHGDLCTLEEDRLVCQGRFSLRLNLDGVSSYADLLLAYSNPPTGQMQQGCVVGGYQVGRGEPYVLDLPARKDWQLWRRPLPVNDGGRVQVWVKGKGNHCRFELGLAELWNYHPTALQRIALDRHERSLDGKGSLSLHSRSLGLINAESSNFQKASQRWLRRELIPAPAASTYTWRVDLPPGAQLRFATAIEKLARTDDRVKLDVLVDGERVFSEQRDGDHKRWAEHRIDLEGRQGPTEITFSCEALDEASLELDELPIALWAEPVIEVPVDSSRPDVLMIVVSALRADRLLSFDPQRDAGLHIDGLAKQGAVFEKAFASSNRARASTASLLTGLEVPRHGLVATDDRLDDELETLAERFRSGGWRTAAIAMKASLVGHGFEQGFENFLAMPRSAPSTETLVDLALEHLIEGSGRPDFLLLHLNQQHQPFDLPIEDLSEESAAGLKRYAMSWPARILPGLSNCSDCGSPDDRDPEFEEWSRKVYDDELLYLDRQIGRLLEGLKANGLDESTVIALVADHGQTLWDHFDYIEHGGSSLHDELLHVPLIIKPRADADLPNGHRVSTQVRGMDLAPTLLEMAGLEIPAMQARSLLPVWRGEESDDRLLFSFSEDSAAIRTPGLKVIRQLPPRAGREQVFDLVEDSGELVNQAIERELLTFAARERSAANLVSNHPGQMLLILGESPGLESLVLESTRPLQLLPTAHLGLPLVESDGEGRLFVFTGNRGGRIRLGIAIAGPFEASELSLSRRVAGVEEAIELQLEPGGPQGLSRRLDDGYSGALLFGSGPPAGNGSPVVEIETIAGPQSLQDLGFESGLGVR